MENQMRKGKIEKREQHNIIIMKNSKKNFRRKIDDIGINSSSLSHMQYLSFNKYWIINDLFKSRTR